MGDRAHIEFEAVDMAFGGRSVFRNLSCAMPKGRITVILGGSGSGKSTMLRLIGGLMQPRAGHIRVDGRDVTRLSERELYDVRRGVGMLFQGGALLDSLSVFDNLALPLREHTALDETAIATEVHDRLAAVGLRDVDGLLPSQLSGGMVKRVGLARAIIRRPHIVLADEPFSGLDPISTKRIEGLLRRINASHELTLAVVSHDIDSTMRMADWIVMLQDGGAVQGTPAELRQSPDRRVRAFLGEDPGDEHDPDALAEIA
jgi:phospholipid/cholesterol/gamma-HCH transport system ATP-binding protein